MLKRHLLIQGLISVFITFAFHGQSQNFDQFLNSGKANADAIKKNSPPAKQTKSSGLPAGYDNSWRINVTLTRTVTSEGNLTSKDKACPATDKSTSSFIVQAGISTDKAIGRLNGDDFTIFTDVDKSLKPFTHPFTGSYFINSDLNGVHSDCSGSLTNTYKANSNVDLKDIDVSFYYNNKSKQGNFNIHIPDDLNITASGTSKSVSKTNGSHTADFSEYGKDQTAAYAGLYGNFAAWNYEISKDPNIQQLQNSSPLMGSLASITETKFGYEIRYSQTKVVQGVNSDNETGSSNLTYNTSVEISITDTDPIQYDAILESFAVDDFSGDYKNWIPLGPPPPNPKNPASNIDHGNSIGFRIVLVDKKTPTDTIPNVPYDVDYLVTDFSHEPGYCVNYPLNSKDDGKPDIKFNDQIMRKTNIIYSPKEVKTTDYTGSGFFALFTSYDYGGFVKFTATVILKDGTRIPAHFANDKKTVVQVPEDENNNRIADAWEKAKGIFDKNYDAIWDGEKQQLDGDVVNNNDGDGLTLYEEYRGFIAKGQFMRLDPTKKELFVINEIGDEAKPGLELFTSASDIQIIELTDQDIDKTNRIINMNSVYGMAGKQHAVILRDYQSQNKDVFGNTPSKEGGDSPPTSPGDCLYVGIVMRAPFKEGELAETIAHELAHSCGVWHHGPQNLLKAPKIIDDSYIFYASDMSPAAKESIDIIKKKGLLGDIAGPGGQSSGDMHCIMCYEDLYVWSAPKGLEGKIFINVDFADECIKDIFCNSNEGTYWNSPGFKPLPVYGNATKGDCIHQFKVKDW